jgi:nucleoside-diphosphate-sugar epimerase
VNCLASTSPSLLVVGCGDLGGAVAARAAARGWRVWGVRRSTAGVPGGVAAIAADVTDPTALAPLAALRPQLVLCALTPGGFSDECYRAVYVDGLRNVLAALDRSELRRVVWVSSTSVYHQDDGTDVDEASVALPRTFSGRRLLEAERLLADAGLPHSIVRFGGIYGPGRDRLLRQLQGGVRSPQRPPRWSNRIHRDDCVGVLDFLLERAADALPLDDLYLGVDAEPAPMAEIERWFAARLGLDYAALREGGGESRGGNRRCLGARLQMLGYRFRYPSYREGLPTLLKPTPGCTRAT